MLRTDKPQGDLLEIGDKDFAVKFLIEKCPPNMMLRELVKNAIEAAEKAEQGNRRIKIFIKKIPELFGDTRKLAIWNTGPGMNGAELNKMCDLASSINKKMGLSANYGMGAKVASLTSNPLGMRYRSCKDGEVNEVTLGQKGGDYVKFFVTDPETGEDSYETVLNVTEKVFAEDKTLFGKGDWTEVVLYGAADNQDTSTYPYNIDEKEDKQWVATNLYHRFYRIPDGVEIYLDDGLHKNTGVQRFKPISTFQKKERFTRAETVDVEGGIRIHYLHDKSREKSSHNQLFTSALTSSVMGFCSLIFDDEMYDVRKSNKWSPVAPMFGIPFGSAHIFILIELPHDYHVMPESYRQFLQFTKGDQRRVCVEDFAKLVHDNRPEWLIEVINSYTPKTSISTEDLQRELQSFLDELRIQTDKPKINNKGVIPADVVNSPTHPKPAPPQSEPVPPGPIPSQPGPEATPPKPAPPGPKPTPTPTPKIPFGVRKASISKKMEQAPRIHLLYKEEDISEKNIVGKAARYYQETNNLFINMQYSAIEEAEYRLKRDFASHEEIEVMHTLAKQWAEDIVKGKVGYAVIFAKAKQLRKEWTPDAVKKALEPESLSLAADSWRDKISRAKRSMGTRLKSPTSKLQEQPEHASV